jgi:hypothetical protein
MSGQRCRKFAFALRKRSGGASNSDATEQRNEMRM